MVGNIFTTLAILALQMPTPSGHADGFLPLLDNSLVEVIGVKPTLLSGSIPEWLEGNYIRQAPSLHSTSKRTLNHMFDGFAKLYIYSFNSNQSTPAFSTQFVRSKSFNRTIALDSPAPEFLLGTVTPSWNASEALDALVNLPDNTGINVWRFGDKSHRRYSATTDGMILQNFDPTTGGYKGSLMMPMSHRSDDSDAEQAILAEFAAPGSGMKQLLQLLPMLHELTLMQAAKLPLLSVLSTAHPHHAVDDDTLTYNVAGIVNPMAVIAPEQHHHSVGLYAVQGDLHPRLIAEVPTDGLHYIHSFSITRHYAVVLLWPATIDIPSLTSACILDTLRWNASGTTRFIAIDLETGRLVADTPTDPFFAYHHVNAFEQVNPKTRQLELVVDTTHFRDIGTMWFWLLPNITNTTFRNSYPDHTCLRRITVALDSQHRPSYAAASITDMHMHSDRGLRLSGPELPRINYEHHNGRPYCYVYGYSGHAFGSPLWSDAAVVKADLCQQINDTAVHALTWFEEGVYPSEAIFIPHPVTEAEDDGLLLFDAYDSHNNQTLLIMLDASTMIEVARIASPVFMPWPLHAQFYRFD
eukprot:TRINITY_DN2261_c0_g1_i1.p1 TRINITY_DN2261_c0_g1~~TRINITY_DN2261_c0_g1_i1.p1  ORF type:complete len:582 (+),score=75.71 TRINITY_DN2261_c0_g1_i1:98-1843(+)